MKQKSHRKIRSPFVRVMLHILKFLLETLVISLRASKNRKHPTTHELMQKLYKNDPTIFDPPPSHHRNHHHPYRD